ncbi:MAG: hypothetical protein NTW87_27445 [Planctomycetota bacterium]|nr:hypothetical protein [Planctomycetota bacterium]
MLHTTQGATLFTLARSLLVSVCLLNGGCGANPQKPKMFGPLRVYEVGHPGVVVGVVTRPTAQASECTYVLLLKPPAAGVAHVQQQTGPGKTAYGEFSNGGGYFEETSDVALDGCRMDIHLRIDFRSGSETLSLNGSNMDLAKGRVFLVEQTATGPVYTQKNVPLSMLGVPRFDPDFAHKAATTLSELDPGIKQFLETKSQLAPGR